MQIAVFDLDHTFLEVNIAYEFGKYLYYRGNLKLPLTLFLIAVYFFYKIKLVPVRTLHRMYYKYILDVIPLTERSSLIESFLQAHFRSFVNPHVEKQLTQALKKGYYTLLLSASPSFLVEKIGAEIGVHESLGTSYTDQGELQVLDGNAKAAIVAERAQKLGVDLNDIVAYSDSSLDLPLLKLVGNPVVVSPNLKLKIYSKMRRWKILC